MIDKFEAEKRLQEASTDNLAHMIMDKRPDAGRPSGNPRAIQIVQVPGPGLKVCEKPWGLPGGMLALGID